MSGRFDAYQRWLIELAPGWLRGPKGRAFLEALGALLDDYVQLLLDGVKARYPRRAPAELVHLIGETREIGRFPREEEVTYRERLAAAFESWAWAGTERGVRAALKGAGFNDVSIYPVYLEDPRRWAEVDLRLRPPTPTRDRLAHVVMIVNETKPAHVKLRCIVIECPKLNWSTGAHWNKGLRVWGRVGENMAAVSLCRTSWRGPYGRVWGAPYLFWNTPGVTW